MKFAFIADIFNHYGIKLAVMEPTFTRTIDTTIEMNTANQDESPPTSKAANPPTTTAGLQKTGIPPSLNLRCLFSILLWALQVS